MAFSGTVSQTVFDTRKVIEHAIRQCKVPAQQITSEHVDIAKDQLHLMLSAWANDGVQLWCIEKVLVPLYAGTPAAPLPAGTVDVLNANLRVLREVSPTSTAVDTASYVLQTAGGTSVTTIGLLWSAAATPVLIQTSDDGVLWTTVQAVTPEAPTGGWTWLDLDNAQTAPYYRVQATGGTLDLSRVYLGGTPTETPLSRLNRDDWTSLPNKTFESSRPLQYWLDRQARTLSMRLWPVPNAEAETSQLVVWRYRHIMDVGSLTQEIEVPQRWYDAVVSGLAARLVIELVEANMQMLPILEARAEKALYLAQQEERDNSSVHILPNIGMYTA